MRQQIFSSSHGFTCGIAAAHTSSACSVRSEDSRIREKGQPVTKLSLAPRPPATPPRRPPAVAGMFRLKGLSLQRVVLQGKGDPRREAKREKEQEEARRRQQLEQERMLDRQIEEMASKMAEARRAEIRRLRSLNKDSASRKRTATSS